MIEANCSASVLLSKSGGGLAEPADVRLCFVVTPDK